MRKQKEEGARGREDLLFTSSLALREQAAGMMGMDGESGLNMAMAMFCFSPTLLEALFFMLTHLLPNCAREQAVISRVHSHAYPGTKRLTSVESHWVIGR
jgi:hypothetical protein